MKFRQNHISILLVVCVLCLTLASQVWSATYYVDINNGTDDTVHGIGPGASAWKTFHYAVVQLQDDDILNVASGTYSIENGELAEPIFLTQNNITIQGTSGAVLDGSPACSDWYLAFDIGGSDVMVNNLKVTNFFCDGGYEAIPISGNSNNTIIESCEISNNGDGIVFGRGTGTGTMVYNNTIHDNVVGIAISGSSPQILSNTFYENDIGISSQAYIGDISQPIITNNLIYDPDPGSIIGTNMGIEIYTTGTGSTVAAQIYHNTFVGSGQSQSVGIWVSEEAPDLPGGLQVKYNIINGFDIGIQEVTPASGVLDIDYNNIFGNNVPYQGVSAGNNDVTDFGPDFVDPPNFDFHLQATSPIIDYIGGIVGDPVLVDRDGGVRPIGLGKEPGCYEFRAASDTIALPMIEAGRNINDFKMISIVHLPDNPDPQAVFNINYNPNNYRIGTWSPEQGRYIEFGQGLTMEPGRAYWILARNGLAVNFKGVPVSMDDYAEVCLYCNDATGKGWNMIAPPNAANYRWNAVLVGRWLGDNHPDNVEPVPVTYSEASDLINHRIYEWQNGKYVDHRIDEDFVLEYYEGYWVKALVDGVYLEFHASARVAGLSTPRNTMLAWKGKAVKWMKSLLPSPREAMADNDLPPVPMESFDGGANPLFEGCFVQSVK